MNMDDIDDLIKLLMDGEDDVDLNKFKRNHVKIKFYDDDENVKNDNLKKTNPYMSSEDIIKNRTNKPNKKFSSVYQSNDKILKGTYNKLVAVRNGIGLLKENLESMLKVVNELDEDLKNV